MKKILPFLFLALGLISCTSEFDQQFNTPRQGARGPKVVFQASTEGPAATTLYMKTGQTIPTLNLPEGANIEFK